MVSMWKLLFPKWALIGFVSCILIVSLSTDDESLMIEILSNTAYLEPAAKTKQKLESKKT